jgi:dihydroorotate dehydrogenase (NAD+) catalytic subunit
LIAKRLVLAKNACQSNRNFSRCDLLQVVSRWRCMAKLNVSVCGINFSNPIMPAAGPPTRDGAMCQAAANGGAGGIVTKTISVDPADVPRPCMAEVRGGMLNTELWSELPKERWIETEYKMARETGLPILVGLGYTAEQIKVLAPLVKPYADALELSTHYVGNDISPIVDALKAAKDAVDVPVFMKMSPHPNIQAIAGAVEEAGADALVMINSFGPCFGIDVETGMPLLGSREGHGWLSGAAIKPLALRCVYDAARVVKVPIIGVGGIMNGRDVAEMFMAGASAVQVCTLPILKGPNVYGKLANELNSFLDSHGYASVEDIRGLTIRKMAEREAMTVPVVDQGKCNLCGLCGMSCAYGAISQAQGLYIDPDKCFGCGLCVTRCAKRALSVGTGAALSN